MPIGWLTGRGEARRPLHGGKRGKTARRAAGRRARSSRRCNR